MSRLNLRSFVLPAVALAAVAILSACVSTVTEDKARGVVCYRTYRAPDVAMSCVRVVPETVYVHVVSTPQAEVGQLAPKQGP